MMKLIVFVLAVVLPMCMSKQSAICEDYFSEAPSTSPECLLTATEPEDGNVTCSLLGVEGDSNNSWSVVDSEAGTVSFELSVAPSSCKHEYYKMYLITDETITDPEICSMATVLNDEHSTRILDIKRAPVPNRKIPDCGEVTNVMFHNVFTGCYIFEVLSFIGINERPYYQIKPVFIETNYTKINIVNRKPAITTQYLPASNENDLLFILNRTNELNVTRMHLEMRVCKNETSRCGDGNYQRSWEITLSTSGNFMCMNMDKSKSRPPDCILDEDDHVIRCTVYNLTTPGYYCVLVQFMDDRCEPDTLWYSGKSSKCLYNTSPRKITPYVITTNTSITAPTGPSTSGAPVVSILVSVFVVVGLILVGVLLYLWRKRKPGPDLGAWSCLKYNILEYYNKIDDKQNESMVKKLNSDC